MKTVFRNARLVTRGNETTLKDIEVSEGVIRRVESPGVIPANGTNEIDLGSRLTLPGAIDGHVHFDDPGFTEREDFEHGTRSAAAGGVTCVVDMPCTSLPPVVHAAAFRGKLSVVEPKAHVDFCFWGGVSGNVMRDHCWREYLASLRDEGVAAIKIYLTSGMSTFRDLTLDQAREVFVECARLGLPVGVHAEDKRVVEEATRASRARDTIDAYADGRPVEAEIRAVADCVRLARETGAKTHIVHLGSGEALDMIVTARQEGVSITAETCPHFLAFTRDDLVRVGSVLKTAPVVKSESDRQRLWQGVANGDIAFVTTDHAAAVWPGEKRTGSAWTDYGGVPGVETLLPYLYSEGYRRGRVTLERLIQILCHAPSEFFGIRTRKGHIATGLDADFVVIDESSSWTVRGEDTHCLNRYSPFDGMTFDGRVDSTWVRGERVYQRGAEPFGEPGWGQIVRVGR